MKKFLVTYHTPVEAMEQMMNVPAEQQAEGMKAWMQWAQKCGDKLLDLGSPLMNGQQLNADGSSRGSGHNVSGYSILQADSLDEAKALLKGHPHLGGWSKDATIEVHETMSLPGM